MRKLLLACLVALLASGCSLVTVNIRPEVQPLEEKVLEGEGADKVLLIAVDGVISEGRGGQRPFSLSEKVGMIPQLKEQLDKAEADPAVRAVVLRVNSPGGSVTASDIIYHELAGFKSRKGVPLVASLSGLAASGGYYVACAADHIIAHPTTVTGSIGVLALKVSAAGLLEKIGVANETLTAGGKKDMWSPLRPLTPEERAIFQGILDQLDTRFLEVVRLARRPQPGQVAVFSDGRVLDAREALKLGLVDRLGYVEDAIEEAKGLAGIKRARVVTYARPGEYRNNVYSVSGPAGEPEALSLEGAWLATLSPGVHFFYLWAP
jgi:protease-4